MAAKNKKIIPAGTEDAGMLFNVFFVFLVLLLPLVYYRSAQDASMLPRILTLACFLLGYSIYLFAFHREKFLARNLLTTPVFILGGGYFLITLLSFTASFNKSEGLFDITKTGLTLIILYYAVRLIIETPRWFEKLSEILILSSFIALIIGFYQYFTLVAGNPGSYLPDGREIIYAVSGLMGNKNEFASSLLLILPFSIYTAFIRKGLWRTLAAVSCLFLIIMLILLATRAVWVGFFFGGLMISVIILLYRNNLKLQKQTVRKIVLTGSILVILITAGVIEGGRYSHNAFLTKLGSIVRPAESNNHFRLNIWKITSEMVGDHPLTGVGPGNWQIIIPEYYHKIGLKDKEVNWISPHNDFLWIGSEKGIPGLLLYLGMIALSIFYVFKILRGNSEIKDKWITLTLFSGLTAYLVVACFDFPYQRIDHQVMFTIFIGGLVTLYHQHSKTTPGSFRKVFFYIPVSIFLLFCILYSYKALQVEIHVKKAIAFNNAGYFAEALQETGEAGTPFRSLDAKGSPVEYYAGMAHASLNNHHMAVASYNLALTAHPNHIALLNNIGKSYYAIGYYGMAEHYYLKALKIVPNLKEARVNLATLYYVKGNYRQSYEMLKDLRGGKKTPEIRQNRKALEKLLEFPSDSLKAAKHKNKKHIRDKKKIKGD